MRPKPVSCFSHTIRLLSLPTQFSAIIIVYASSVVITFTVIILLSQCNSHINYLLYICILLLIKKLLFLSVFCTLSNQVIYITSKVLNKCCNSSHQQWLLSVYFFIYIKSVVENGQKRFGES